MNQFSIIDVIKFGFDKSIKKFFFFIATYIVAFFIWVGFFFLSVLVSGLFFIPAMKLIGEVRALIMSSSAGDIQEAGSFIFGKFIELLGASPFAFVSAIFGVVVFAALMSFLMTMISMGMVKISLDIYDKGYSVISNLFVRPLYVFRGLFAGILVFLMLAIGPIFSLLFLKISFWLFIAFLFLVILVDIYLVMKFFFASYFIIDKGLGTTEALRASWRLYGAPYKLLLFWLMLAVVAVVFWAIPLQVLKVLPTHIVLDVFAALLNIAAQYIFSIVTFMGYTFIYKRLSSN